MKLKQILSLLGLVLALACSAPAAVPAPDKLLASDTLAVMTVPDFKKLRETTGQGPMRQLWNDPSMKAFKDKFLDKLKSDVITPFERELGVKLSDYSELAEGQITFAVTQNGWDGTSEAKPGVLLLVDAGSKADTLKTNLAALRQKWVDSGKQIKTEKIRDIEFATLVASQEDLKKTLGKALGEKEKPGDKDQETPSDKPSAKLEWMLGQSGSLFIAGTLAKDIEKVLIRQSGGAVPSLGDQAAFSSSSSLFRDAHAYGWVNTKTIIDAVIKQLAQRSGGADDQPAGPMPKIDKVLASAGLTGLQTVAFNFRDQPEGSYVNLSLGVPESGRRGVFKVLSFDAKDAGPVPFVPADAVKFTRWRLDLPKAFATLENTLVEISPQMSGFIKLIMDTAGKDKDPNFDLRKNLIGNLGDDIISFEKAPRKQTLADLQSPPSIVLIGSPRAEQLASAVTALGFLAQPGKSKEREFLGRKVYSIGLPPRPAPGGRPVEQTLHYAASGGYVALSTDVAMLEEYLRASGSDVKPLRDTPGLADAAQKVGGMGTGLFGFENQAETIRAAWEILKKESGTLANLFSGSPVAGHMKDGRFNEWVDFSSLPSYDKVAKYFSFTVVSGGVNAEGFQVKMFAPTPPQLKK